MLAVTKPVSPPQAWDFLDACPHVRRYPRDAASFVAAMQEEFTADELEKANIISHDGDNEIRPSSFFASNNFSCLFLHCRKSTPPFELVNLHGCLRSDEPPVLAASRDFRTLDWCRNSENSLIATFDIDSVAGLRALKLPATVATGLGAMDGSQLRRLFGDPTDLDNLPAGFDELRPRFPYKELPGCYGSQDRGVTIVLAGWNVAELSQEEPAGLRGVVIPLAKAADNFGFDLSGVQVWRPSQAEIDGISQASQLRDIRLVRKEVLLSIEYSTWDVESFCSQEYKAAREPVDLRSARQELLRELERFRSCPSLSRGVADKLTQLNESFDCDVIRPLLSEAISATDPVRRTLLIHAAELAERWHAGSPLVVRAKNHIQRDGRPSDAAEDPDELKQRLQITDQLVKIHKQLSDRK